MCLYLQSTCPVSYFLIWLCSGCFLASAIVPIIDNGAQGIRTRLYKNKVPDSKHAFKKKLRRSRARKTLNVVFTKPNWQTLLDLPFKTDHSDSDELLADDEEATTEHNFVYRKVAQSETYTVMWFWLTPPDSSPLWVDALLHTQWSKIMMYIPSADRPSSFSFFRAFLQTKKVVTQRYYIWANIVSHIDKLQTGRTHADTRRA